MLSKLTFNATWTKSCAPFLLISFCFGYFKLWDLFTPLNMEFLNTVLWISVTQFSFVWHDSKTIAIINDDENICSIWPKKKMISRIVCHVTWSICPCLHVCIIFILKKKKAERDSTALARCVTSPVGATLLHCASGLIVWIKESIIKTFPYARAIKQKQLWWITNSSPRTFAYAHTHT